MSSFIEPEVEDTALAWLSDAQAHAIEFDCPEKNGSPAVNMFTISEGRQTRPPDTVRLQKGAQT